MSKPPEKKKVLVLSAQDVSAAVRAAGLMGKAVEAPRPQGPPVPSEPAQPLKVASTRKQSKAGRTFHQEAFQLWVTEKLSYPELGKRVGVSEDTIFDWAKKEGWAEMLEQIDARNKKAAVRSISDQVGRIAARHQKVARLAIRKIFSQLKNGTLMIDPMTGLFHAKQDADGNPKLRPLLPGEINQLLQGFQKAADLEYGRAGGSVAPSAAVDVRFPDLIKLLEAVWSGKKPQQGQVVDVTPRVLAVTGATDPREQDT
jgi:hypothetical protein